MRAILVDTVEKAERLLEHLRTTNEVGFDTESDGPQLTFDKMLNVYESSIVGFSVAVDDTGYYVPVRHTTGTNCPPFLTHRIKQELLTKQLWAHNWKHEMLAGFLPVKELPTVYRNTVYLDSMVTCWLASMGVNGRHGLKALAQHHLNITAPTFEETFGDKSVGSFDPQAVVEYACHDAVNTLALGRLSRSRLQEWGLWEHAVNVEMPFVAVLARMEQDGMHVDQTSIRGLEGSLRQEVEAVLEAWDFLLPGISITSTQQISAALFDVHWPTKGIPKTKTGKLQVTGDVLEELLERTKPGSLGHEAARLKLQYQAAAKYLSTYTHSLLEAQSNYSDERLHPSFHHTGTVTGRLSCSSPNLQNIPAHSDTGKAIKACFVPSPGNVFVEADYSQIEPRVLAHYVGGELSEVYKRREDIYNAIAARISGSRQDAKTLVLAMMYGVGPKKVARNLGVTYKQALDLIKAFKEGFPEIEGFRHRVISVATERGYIKTFLGRRRYIEELSVNSEDRWRGERLAMNTPIQGSAADIMKLAMLQVYKKMPSQWKLVAQVHDALTLEVPESAGQEAAHLLKTEMESVVTLRVPLVAEPKIGRSWAECK